MSPSLVLDCSIVMAWCFVDENTPPVLEVQDRLASEAAVVPAHWYLEVTNVLTLAERRKRISPADVALFLQLLGALDIQFDDEPPSRAFEHILPLCHTYGLTSYDAAYLDLVKRRQLPLASLDDDLRQAVMSLGLAVFGK